MKVTIKDVLGSSAFKNQHLLAGETGLDNEVKYISVLETEPEQNNDVFRRTEVLYITSMYYQKDSTNEMIRYFDHIKKLKASGVCVIDDYVQSFPPEITDFCDKNKLPLILVDHNVPYADMISSVMELIILSQQEKIMENRIKALEKGNLSRIEARETMQELNPHFKSNITAFFVVFSDKYSISIHKRDEFIRFMNDNLFYFACPYKGGILVLCSYNQFSDIKYEKLIHSILNHIRRFFPDTTIGISKDLLLDECGEAISQAVVSTQIYRVSELPKCIHYDDLGVIKLLYSFMGSKELENFYKETIDAILKYDAQYNSDLFMTLESFLENDCNYKISSRELSVHENTVRYRMERIRQILNFHGTDMELFHTLSVAYKIFLLKNNI